MAKTDHPRACGEHAYRKVNHTVYVGSSPRMRGAQDAAQRRGTPDGIIPAHAGSTAARQACDRVSRDHPRACGEHSSEERREIARKGSSPRMRGALSKNSYLQHLRGIIPAHAGSTISVVWLHALDRDHPRACGEHEVGILKTLPSWGSSPRMRGALVALCRLLVEPGIIPAHAGSTYNVL